MNPDLLKILSTSNKQIEDSKLMEYLAGQLSPKEMHEVESMMAESDFVNDAVEGLQQVDGKKKIEQLVENLNKELSKKLEQKKSRKDKKRFKDHPWIYLAIALILLLITVAWFVISQLHNGR